MITYVRPSRSQNDSEILDRNTYHGTVCAKDFNFKMADYFCELVGYKFCRQWGRVGDTNKNFLQE